MVFETKQLNQNYNVLIWLFLVYSVLGIFWLSNLQIAAGIMYMSLILLGVILLIFAIIFFKTEKFHLIIPINVSNIRASLVFVLGLGLALLLFVTSKITRFAFFNPKAMAPMASFSTGIVGEQTFSALKATGSSFWTWFSLTMTAPIVEEIITGFIFVIAGIFIMYGIMTLAKIDYGKKTNKQIMFWGAIGFSILFFTSIHLFNGTYDTAREFIEAGVFRAVLNIVIYKFKKLGLMFSIGFHKMVNELYIWTRADLGLGPEITKQALTSLGGIIIIFIFALIVFYLIANYKETFKEIGKLFSIGG